MNPFIWNTLGIALLLGAFIAVLILGKTVLVPIAFAFFCAFLLRPGVNKLQSKKFPKPAAILVMLIALIIGIAIIFSAFGYALSTFTDNISEAKGEVGTKIENLDNKVFEKFGFHLPITKRDAETETETFRIGAINTTKLFTGTATTLGTIPVVFVLTFFILLYRQKFKKFILKITHGKHRVGLEKAIQKIGSIIPSYLIGVITVASILTVLLFLGFWGLRIDSPLFFAILIALLNIIPYAGTILGFAIVVIWSALSYSTGTTIGVIALFMFTQFLDNNFLTPLIAGRKIDLNPLASILGIIVGGILWGIPGMVLALPTLGVLKILCDTIPRLEPFGYLLGNE
jgi:predicted PurR-regulated permease PerM